MAPDYLPGPSGDTWLPSTTPQQSAAVSGSNPQTQASDAPTQGLTSQTENQALAGAVFGNGTQDPCDSITRVIDIRKRLITPILLDFGLLGDKPIAILISMLPENVRSIVGNGRLRIKGMPFLSSVVMGVVMLRDGELGENLRALWGATATAAAENVLASADAFKSDLENVVSRLGTIAAVSMNNDGLNEALGALRDAKAHGVATPEIFSAQLGQICSSLGRQSRAMFELDILMGNLSAAATDLTLLAELPISMISSAENAILSSGQLADANISKLIFNEIDGNLNKDIDRLNGLNNITFGGPCGANAVKELSILRNACSLADDTTRFLSQNSLSIEELVKSAAVSMASRDMYELAERARNLIAPDLQAINLRIQKALNEALAAAQCGGGSAELANTTAAKVGREILQITTAVSAVATVYATARAMSQTFEAGLAMMQQFSGASNLNMVLMGDIAGFLNKKDDSLDAPMRMKIVIQALDECAKKQENPKVKRALENIAKKMRAQSAGQAAMQTAAGIARATQTAALERTELADKIAVKG